MNDSFETPQEAEDAYYDALEEGDPDRLLSIWADGDEVCCLLPMYPMILGRPGVEDAYAHLLSQGQGVELSITHLQWIEAGDIAIHQVEEQLPVPSSGSTPPPLYATNIFRKDNSGWRMTIHLNAPTPPPPPPELVMPE